MGHFLVAVIGVDLRRRGVLRRWLLVLFYKAKCLHYASHSRVDLERGEQLLSELWDGSKWVQRFRASRGGLVRGDYGALS